MKHFFTKCLFSLALMLMGTLSVYAQGVTTASMGGVITDKSDETLIGVTVMAVHEPSGSVYGTMTREDGRFNLLGMRVGGPYTITLSYTGFEAVTKKDVYLSLGQTYLLKEKMGEDPVMMGELVVEAKRSLLNTDKNGAGTDISAEEIAALPTVARDISDYARLTPQASISEDNIISIAGANNRFNSIYIDGAVNNDVFGLAASGTNGGQIGVSPISPDAIEQFNVVVAPYDVKLSGFAGGGINAVTRAGSNKVDGSAYYLVRNERLAGFRPSAPDSLSDADRRLPKFTAATYGVRVGGPLKKDKAFFFINMELQNNETPQPFDFANYRGTSTQDQIQAFSDRLRNEYGYDAGSFLSKNITLEGRKILGRLDFNLGRNHKLMLRHHYTYGNSTYANASSNTTLRFAGFGITFPSITNSSAVELNSVWGSKFSNNFIFGYTNVNDDRNPTGNPFPRIEIQDGAGTILAGSENFSTANSLKQNIFTLTNNFNIYQGNHQITFGTHNEFFDIYNLFIRNSVGAYRYSSLNDFMTGARPNQYQRSYSLIDDISTDGSKAAAEFQSFQLGLYAQDEVQFTPRVSASFGIRADVPFFLDNPTEATIFNETVRDQLIAAGHDVQGARAGQSPKPQVMLSPRIGFNWNALGERDLVVRGGVGIFTSRIPFVWPGGMFTNNGKLLADLSANATDIANFADFTFQGDPNRQYTLQDFGKTAGTSQLDLFAKNFRYPQTLRTSLAADIKMPWGMVGTLEGIYSKTINNVIYQDINSVFSNSQLAGTGPDKRDVYPTGSSARISNAYTNILLGYNTNEGDSYSLTAQVQKPFKNGFTGSVAYTFGRSTSINDLTSSQNSSNWVFNEHVNGQNFLPLSYSDFDLGSRIVGFLSKRITYGKSIGGATTLSLFYNGQSGRRFSYTYTNNLNGAGFQNGQNLIYIPATQADINLVNDASIGDAASQWAALDAFIKGDEYLNANRGSYAERNGARMPFTNIFDLKVAQDFTIRLGDKPRGIQVSLDIFNVGNLINQDWGRRFFVANDNYNLIQYTGMVAGVPTFKFRAPTGATSKAWGIDELGINSSLWQGQLGLRLNF